MPHHAAAAVNTYYSLVSTAPASRLQESIGIEFEDAKRRHSWDTSEEGNTFLGVTSGLSLVRSDRKVVLMPTYKRLDGILRLVRGCRSILVRSQS